MRTESLNGLAEPTGHFLHIPRREQCIIIVDALLQTLCWHGVRVFRYENMQRARQLHRRLLATQWGANETKNRDEFNKTKLQHGLEIETDGRNGRLLLFTRTRHQHFRDLIIQMYVRTCMSMCECVCV